MSIPVRPAVLADAPEIAACLAVLGYDTPPALVAERLTAFATSDVDAVFVAGGPPGARWWRRRRSGPGASARDGWR